MWQYCEKLTDIMPRILLVICSNIISLWRDTMDWIMEHIACKIQSIIYDNFSRYCHNNAKQFNTKFEKGQ